MSLFTKRKGRRISTLDNEDDERGGAGGAPLGDEDQSTEPEVQPIRFGKRAAKPSVLRRSIHVDDADDTSPLGADQAEDTTADDASAPQSAGDNDQDGPAVVRPTVLGRSGSRRNKKRLSTASTASASRFSSFGDNDGNEADSGPVVVTPKRSGAGKSTLAAAPSLTQRVLETNAFRRSLSGRLPTRRRDDDGDSRGGAGNDYGDDDDDNSRPRYSKAYLDELQSSTPNTPKNLSKNASSRQQPSDDGDAMDLDPSELEGAMVVDASELGALAVPAAPGGAPAAHVLTATEIQERKDRRARLALEENAIVLGSDDDEETGFISLLPEDRKKSNSNKESRLVREDEDLGEGYDEFVEDGRLSLGRKAEREARRHRKKEMADLIKAAEVGGDADDDADNGTGQRAGGNGDNDDEDDDSEAERRAAYDEAQTRAGMDGLHRQTGRHSGDDYDGADGDGGGSVHGSVPIPRMRPLPDLATCLQQMQSAVAAIEADAVRHRQKLAEVDKEKAEIVAREAEVQAILDAAAVKYQAVLGTAGGTAAVAANGISAAAITQSPLRTLPPGVLAGETPSAARGLESLGTTPTRRPNAEDSVF